MATPIAGPVATRPAPPGDALPAPASETTRLREVAQQFEALFAHMLLKNMRSASLGEGLFDSEQGDLYQDMMDQEMAQALSRKGGLGIAEMLVQQLAPAAHANPSPRHTALPLALHTTAAPPRALHNGAPETGHSIPERRRGPASPATAVRPPDDTPRVAAPGAFDTPADFVRAVWPLARQAAATLRVSPQIILAQAALETGWGKFAPTRADGRSSHNLFGIKASAGWSGHKVEVPTTEVLGGVARKVVAAFRAYGSLAEGVGDYTRLLLSSPRYRAALNTGRNDAAFAQALQDGGYATDPDYAAKILAISRGATLNQALEGLKIDR